ncbi:MAG TPA: hypothetical protein PKX74_13770 [Leptospiraceae bacterium]|nr:hypothetical protein [Leptospiraceae bacterium]
MSAVGETLEGASINKWDYYRFYVRNGIVKTEAEQSVFESVRPFMRQKFSTIALMEGFHEKYLIHEQTHALYELDREFRRFVKAYVDSRPLMKGRLVQNVKKYYRVDRISDSELYSEYAATLVETEYYTSDDEICRWYERFVEETTGVRQTE